MKQTKVIFSLLFISCLFIFSCQNQPKEGPAVEDNAEEINKTSTGKNLKFYMLPAPLQIASAIKIAKTNFSVKLLAPVGRLAILPSSNYLKALNMGIYGVDMGYATVFGYHQTSINYLLVVQKLKDELKISNSFDVSMINRFKNNTNNQDSLFSIILDAFNKTHQFLRDDHRGDIGLLIITGYYIEGLYLASNLIKTDKDTQLISLVVKQKIFLDNLIELFDEFKTDENIKELLESLNDFKTAYSGINVDFNKVDNANDVAISAKDLKVITEKISALRNKIVG